MQGVGRGRPRADLEYGAQLWQSVAFMAFWIAHLCANRRARWAEIVAHLRANGLDDWEPSIASLRPYLRFREGDWGDHHLAGPRTWRKPVYQAARRIVGELLGLSPRTLRLRIEEQDHWGEHLPPLRREDFNEFGQPLARP